MRHHLLAPAAATAVLVLLGGLAGCGSAEGGATTSPSGSSPSSTSGSPSASPSEAADASGASGAEAGVGGCAAGDAALRDATSLAEVDLDGDGSPAPVALTDADAAGCPATLFGEVDGGFVSTAAPEGPEVVAGFGVRLPGTGSDLLVTEQRHPRGGTQTRVYAAAGGVLTELEDDDGNPVVPFVATDTPPAPVSVTCGEGGIVLTEAVAHEPPGVVFTWDVQRTSYAVAAGRAERTAREEVADNVLPGQLRKRFPELARAEVLADCRT